MLSLGPTGNSGAFTLWYSFLMDYVSVEDCDICLHPYWADQLMDGVCENCQQFT